MSVDERDCRVAVVIPCYGASAQILDVLAAIGPEVNRIYVVDDRCPEGTGDLVETRCTDRRVRVLRNPARKGVGGATMAGYRRALVDGASIIVKLDGDGQMDPGLIPRVIAPIARGEADYAKGNRFFRLDDVRQMPTLRLIGNSLLSFLTKLSTGYWWIFDPTNGYTAIHARVLRELPLSRISEGYFFESDLLFRLNTIQAVIEEIPMAARYRGEASSLSIPHALGQFLIRNLANLAKRIFYNYYLRGFNLASIELALGVALTLFGSGVGSYHWIRSTRFALDASSGTVMVAALPVIIGTQLLLGFLSYDMQNMPRTPLQLRLRDDEDPSRPVPGSSSE